MAKLVGHVLAVVGQDLTAIDGPSTVATANGLGQRNPVGTQSFDDSGNVFIYLAGVASLAVGDFVLFGQGGLFTAVRMLNDGNSGGAGSVALAMAAAVASTWGWFQIYGANAVANVTTAATVNSALYRTATTSRASTSAVAKDCLYGAIATAAGTGNVAPVWLNYPFVVDQSTL